MFTFAQWLETTSVSTTIKDVKWIVPLVQCIHITTLGIVFVSVLMIALRILGWMRTDQSFIVVMQRFSPWVRRGMVVLLLSGVTLIIGEPVRELMSLSFWVKMGLIIIGLTSAAAFVYSLQPAVLSGVAEPEFSPRIKVGAMATVALWLTIIFLGRAIAYDVEVWGRWSLSPRQ